jgi:hypothetical protein
MIQGYIADIAAHMGINQLKISVVEGRDAGCIDVYLLHLTTCGRLVNILVYQSELDDLHNNIPCSSLDVKVNKALSRLLMMLES